MACPAVTGMAARVLASSAALTMPRAASRSEAVVKAILASAKSLADRLPPAVTAQKDETRRMPIALFPSAVG